MLLLFNWTVCLLIIGERDTLRSVQSRIADIYIYIVRANFVLITRKEGGA